MWSFVLFLGELSPIKQNRSLLTLCIIIFILLDKNYLTCSILWQINHAQIKQNQSLKPFSNNIFSRPILHFMFCHLIIGQFRCHTQPPLWFPTVCVEWQLLQQTQSTTFLLFCHTFCCFFTLFLFIPYFSFRVRWWVNWHLPANTIFLQKLSLLGIYFVILC